MPQLGDLKVWYVPQVPGKAYEVPAPDLKTAILLRDAIVGLSIFEFRNRIKPDYCDAVGIVRYEEDGEDGFNWFDLDDYEIEELLDEAKA